MATIHKGIRSAKSVPKAPLHLLSAVLIGLADWAILGLNILTTLHAYWIVNLGSALATGALTALIERRLSWASTRGALLRGCAAAVVVAVPLPLLGTAVALAMPIWAWASSLSERRSISGRAKLAGASG